MQKPASYSIRWVRHSAIKYLSACTPFYSLSSWCHSHKRFPGSPCFSVLQATENWVGLYKMMLPSSSIVALTCCEVPRIWTIVVKCMWVRLVGMDRHDTKPKMVHGLWLIELHTLIELETVVSNYKCNQKLSSLATNISLRAWENNKNQAWSGGSWGIIQAGMVNFQKWMNFDLSVSS